MSPGSTYISAIYSLYYHSINSSNTALFLYRNYIQDVLDYTYKKFLNKGFST